MSRLEPTAASAVIGLAGFQLLQTWNANAPSLSEMRAATPENNTTRTQLRDADFMVGGMAIILGTTYSILTHDATGIVIMMAIFGGVSLWWHAIERAAPAIDGNYSDTEGF